MKVYFGPAVGRSYEPDFMHCVLNLLRKHAMMYRPQCNDALISRSRSIVGSLFLKSDADVLLMIDTDIVFRADDAMRLCQTAHHLQQIVVGLYSTRGEGPEKKPASLLKKEVVIDSTSPVPVEVEQGATGFMAVPRCVFESMRDDPDLPLCHPEMPWAFQPWFQPFPFETEPGWWNYLSEDYAFCERAKRHGYKVLAIPDIRLLHVGPYAYRLADTDYRLWRLDEPRVRYRMETPELVAVGAESDDSEGK